MKNAGLKLVAIVFIGICCFVGGQIYTRQMADEPEVETLTTAGQDALNSKDYAGAIEQFGRALTLNPDDAGLHGTLGLALAGAGRSQDAISEFEECLRLDPGRLDITKQLGMALFKAERFQEAKECFETVVSKDTDDAEAYQWLFTTNERLDLKLENLPVLERLAELLPDDTQYVYAQIMMYHENNQADNALRTFETLPPAERETGKARYVLAAIRFQQQQYAKAIELLEQVVSADPKHTGAQKLLERSYPLAEQARQPEEAIKNINHAIQLNPEDAELRFQLGLALTKTARTEEATNAFQESLSRLDPDNVDLAKRFGKELIELERFDLAEACLEAVADKSDDLEIYELFLAINTRQNRPLENLPILKKMAALRPEESKYIFLQARIHLENGQAEEALRVFRTLPPQQQEQAQHQWLLGVIYFHQKEYSKAIDVLEEVVRQIPDHQDAKNLLAMCHIENGQVEEALRVFRTLPPQQQEQAQNQWLLGVIYFQQKEYSKAIDVLEEVVRQIPDHQDAKNILAVCRDQSRRE